jgi:hypothetical protein
VVINRLADELISTEKWKKKNNYAPDFIINSVFIFRTGQIMAWKMSQIFTTEFHVDTESPGDDIFVIHKSLLEFFHRFTIQNECIDHNQIQKCICSLNI